MRTSNRDRTAAGTLPIVLLHPGKVFWPEEGYTKLDLVEYYNVIFPKLEPYVKDRILTLERGVWQETTGKSCNCDGPSRGYRPFDLAVVCLLIVAGQFVNPRA